MPKYVDDVFHALADPSRRRMVERLAAGPATVSELARPLPMSMPAVVQHLRILQDSGLVRSSKTGRVRTCELDREVLDAAESWFAAQRRVWDQRLDDLGEYLSSTDHEQGRRR
ncbi:metalloregulator ArsR/SmtB family transcription factor [Leifsonia shinshuensis]|uniref:ArsR/SmtB family transcription factor n=1 Tax=Leifsonia shinshuensis TaxID=150026 RepID=UPI001F50F878|nr:metalloregulator ArsR/SmtB family transcription factor [Leifsonia shinshuensis]MCI0158832.1 metalloregulator ArsR/SmtB family transcription factor [Leifsonia shinshuensis]